MIANVIMQIYVHDWIVLCEGYAVLKEIKSFSHFMFTSSEPETEYFYKSFDRDDDTVRKISLFKHMSWEPHAYVSS